MSGFLDDMARSSAARVAQAMRHEPFAALESARAGGARGSRLRLSAHGFDVIAELKLRSPAAGPLGDAQTRIGWGASPAYARGGAAAVSVLTEPSRFDGSLEHLRRAAAALAPLGVPAMRKDFLVDPYQVLEARAAGAGGVLVILRMLPRARMLRAAGCRGRAWHVRAAGSVRRSGPGTLRANCCAARAPRSAAAAARCPDRHQQPRFADAESGAGAIRGAGAAAAAPTGRRWRRAASPRPRDARRMQQLGYRLALIGTALMSRDDPARCCAKY